MAPGIEPPGTAASAGLRRRVTRARDLAGGCQTVAALGAQWCASRRLCSARSEFAGVQQAVGEPVLVGVPGSAGGHPAGQVRSHHRVLVLAEDVLQVLVAVDAVRRLLLAQHRASQFAGVPGAFAGLAGLVQLRAIIAHESRTEVFGHLPVGGADGGTQLGGFTASGGCERRRV